MMAGTRVKVTKKIYTCEDKDACLYAHNKVRSYHKVEPLVWDTKLATNAKNWAIHLLENDLYDHAYGINDGENLYRIPSASHRAYHAVHFFYQEIENYDFRRMSEPNSTLSDDEFDEEMVNYSSRSVKISFAKTMWKQP
ncbi:ectin-like isoform X2 [Hydractinia symbiolongicarpus]|uniref:ectin-like isoform X2 n=1 Tax=Hydractinia symbiolongicarpus TaxID=13093 RepID=UPI00254B6D8C|nr:ectin-like isoform X2 [Hydractinia symbiolongicarpus]